MQFHMGLLEFALMLVSAVHATLTICRQQAHMEDLFWWCGIDHVRNVCVSIGWKVQRSY
jgi:hypothetical protein